MQAMKGFVVVKALDKDVEKTSGGIYVKQAERPNVGHYEVISAYDGSGLNAGDKVWALISNVSKSSNFGDNTIGIVKYDNIMARD